MNSLYIATLETTPNFKEVQIVRDCLTTYNRSLVEYDRYQDLTIFLRDSVGAIVGGLLGKTYWGWLSVDILWIAENLRGQGYGHSLLEMAEQEAIQRGCHHVHLTTMSFQARPFYEREGYMLFGELHDIPVGHNKYFMQKALK